ncbi:MAG TPA: DUF11 domain-containing protein [Planctomycetota bacterium]
MKLHILFATVFLMLQALVEPLVAQDLCITTVADRKKVKIGENITFTITLTNQGPGTATGIVFGDPLPPTLEMVSFSCPVGTQVYPSFCYVESLGAGASVTITLVATPVLYPLKRQRKFLNTTSIVESETVDPNIVNNTASVKVRIKGKYKMPR